MLWKTGEVKLSSVLPYQEQVKHLNVLCSKSAHSNGEIQPAVLHGTQEAPHPLSNSAVPLYQEKSFKKLVSLSLCSATHSEVSCWWIRQFHSSEPRASLLPSHKPWRAGRAFLSFHSDVCQGDGLPVPPFLFPSSLPPAPLLEAASGTTEVQGLTTL